MQANTADTQAQRILLSLLELPIAVGVAFATFVIVYMAGCGYAGMRCVDLSGVPWMLGGALAGLVVAIAYWAKTMRLAARFRRRLLVDAIAIAVGIGAYVVPQIDGWRHAARAKRVPARAVPRPPGVAPAPASPPQIAR